MKSEKIGKSLQKFWRFMSWCSFLASVSLVMCFILVVALYGIYRKDLPKVVSVSDYLPSLKSKVYADNGELIAEFGTKKRILVAKGEIPDLVYKAFVSSEDKNFFIHNGVDFIGWANALFQSLTKQRSTLRGASTITQQLAKSLLIKKEGFKEATARTLGRKIKEAILARRLEMQLKKEEILWMYLNEVYLGHGSYGVGAAAQNYFRKSLHKLTLGQIAMIAGLPQAPSRYSPQNNLKAALKRQRYVLSRMTEEGFISKEEKEDALKANKTFKVFERENNFRRAAPYFSEQVRRLLLEKYGEEMLYEGGLQIFTTLNMERERIMQKTIRENLIRVDKRQGFKGPIFRPENEAENEKAFDLVSKVNQENQFNLSNEFNLARVTHVDVHKNVVRVDTGIEKGIIPLVGMKWAREQNPNKNYDWMQIRSVRGVLQTGDVVLVRKKSILALKRSLLRQNFIKSFQKFLSSYEKQIKSKKLTLFTLEDEPKLEAAMISVEPSSGYVQAMNGGYSFDRSEFNRVYQACRQPGSVFKPIVYMAAISLKKYTPATLILDLPLTYRDTNSQSSWKPRNFERRYKGEVTMREAVMRSMNIPTINTAESVGLKNVISFAKRMGITSKLKMELGTGIGSSCTSPWEIAHVYTTLANIGKDIPPVFIKEVRDRFDSRLEFQVSGTDPFAGRSDRIFQSAQNFFDGQKRILAEEEAFTMHYLLRQSAQFGTAGRTRVLKRPIAGKTGTTNDNFDLWFAGYAKSLATLIWVGNDTMDLPLGVYEQGARTSLPFFNDFMKEALKNLPAEDWEMPATMCEAHIDPKSGLRVEEDFPFAFVAPFECGKEPEYLRDQGPSESLEQLELMGAF